jgi:succinate-semialdehyde dehydrogenase/glutarate-semialdehyde dehydrogenase
VHKSIAKEFTTKLVQKVSELSIGSGFHSKTTRGPLVNRAAVDKVKEHVEDAVAKGGKEKIGGYAPETAGFFFLPTVLTNATRQMKVATEETFGPLAAIFEFDTEDEAVELANDTEFGLAGYFFSKDVGRVLRVARQLQCGMVGVNTGKISAAESPFGGIKESGYGREGSKYGMAEYEVFKTITIGNTNA